MMIESALKMKSTAANVRFEMNATGARKSFHRAIFLEVARGPSVRTIVFFRKVPH